MFIAERHERIRAILLKKRMIDVGALSAMLGVSEGTIRRDLDKLEKEGFVIKTHGGAILNENREKPEPLLNGDEEEHALVADLNAIGAVAARLVQNDEAIFIGGGRESIYLARHLKERQRLTAMTNDLEVGRELSGCAGVRLILTGGNVLQATSVMVGPLAERSLANFFVDRAFICIRGVDLVRGYTVDMPEEARLLQEVMKIARETVILTDATKFDRVGFVPLCGLETAQKLVTNKEIPDVYKQRLFQENVQVFTTYDIE